MAPAIPFITLAISALGAVGSAQSQKQAADIQANNDERDATIAGHNAELVQQQTDRREEMVRRQSRQRLGAMRAASASAGVGLGGSTADIYRQASVDAEGDALNTRYGGLLVATDYINQAASGRYNAKTSRAQGKAAQTAGYVRAGSQLLAGPSGSGWGKK